MKNDEIWNVVLIVFECVVKSFEILVQYNIRRIQCTWKVASKSDQKHV